MKVFFFSSRRRHTSCLSDWSSDVCSSDLVIAHGKRAVMDPQVICRMLPARDGRIELARSEERRVGKECRSRWSADRTKKKTKQRRKTAKPHEQPRNKKDIEPRRAYATAAG